MAAVLALGRLALTRDITTWPIRDQIAAVSVGIVRGTPRLDLEYVEDQVAEVDMNVVATAGGALVEIQGTGEKRSFRREEMDALVDLAFKGIAELGGGPERRPRHDPRRGPTVPLQGPPEAGGAEVGEGSVGAAVRGLDSRSLISSRHSQSKSYLYHSLTQCNPDNEEGGESLTVVGIKSVSALLY